ncbi:ral guanine nucleotide dissociation stimulator-like [Marmota marmota marmota]|uniref:ral guanine nucleotide dissociation stimulator-like n=1 Tax=Marmota marmota marmota TaxID=9994 RepID=UPI002092A261|nr:ral guanine nucleotide dissociation stimulator-like [Marmota marmota marmota]
MNTCSSRRIQKTLSFCKLSQTIRFSESTCKSSRPLSHKLVGDTCLIRVHLDTQSPKMAKTVLVTCHDRAPVVIRRALELHLLTQEKPEEYELGQIISNRWSKWESQMVRKWTQVNS